MFLKMEFGAKEDAMEQNSELCRPCRLDVHAVEQGDSNEGDQLLAEGQNMGPLQSKLVGSDSAKETVYYAVSVPIDSCVGELDGKPQF
jgi:hypothetical protein